MNNQLNKIENLVFGCSGSIGLEISKKLNRNKTLLLSRKKPKALKKCKWIKLDLNGDINHLPKNVERIFFLSSPYYIKKNLNILKLNKEFLWLKKISKSINTKTFVYFSSRSVYYRKHPLGLVKKKCEAFLLKRKYPYLQIWRPFNILGKYENVLSDHFHNILIKNFLFKKKKFHSFAGNINDKRGYCSASKFANTVVKFSKIKKNFLMDYKNTNSIKIKKVIEVFSSILIKKYNIKFKYGFKNKIINKNAKKINNKIKSIDSNENSIIVMRKYFLNHIHEKNN